MFHEVFRFVCFLTKRFSVPKRKQGVNSCSCERRERGWMLGCVGGASGLLTSDSLVVWFVNRELGVLSLYTKRALQYRVETLREDTLRYVGRQGPRSTFRGRHRPLTYLTERLATFTFTVIGARSRNLEDAMRKRKKSSSWNISTGPVCKCSREGNMLWKRVYWVTEAFSF